MSRTISQIYNEIQAERLTLSSLNDLQPNIDTAQTLLTDLNSNSKVAKWRLFVWLVAFGIWVHENLFDNYRAELEARANELITGNLNWYRDQCLIFQYGDNLQWISKKYQYSLIDLTKRIIERAAVIEAAGQVRIKIAKIIVGVPTPLTITELAAFKAYITQVKFAGTDISVISASADLLKLNYDIKYDPQVLSSIGESILTPGVFPVEDAINNFIQNLPFDGVLNLTKLTDSIQLVEGVIDPVINSAEAKYGLLVYTAFLKEYNANAGHMTIDPLFPLNTTLNYI